MLFLPPKSIFFPTSVPCIVDSVYSVGFKQRTTGRTGGYSITAMCSVDKRRQIGSWLGYTLGYGVHLGVYGVPSHPIAVKGTMIIASGHYVAFSIYQ